MAIPFNNDIYLIMKCLVLGVMMPAEELLEMLPMTVDEVSEAASLASDEDAVEVEEVWGVDVAAGEVGPRDEGEDDGIFFKPKPKV